MDVYKEFDKFLEQYGYGVLLVRQQTALRCSCWNEKTQESFRDCPVCFGIGRIPLVEKHVVRDQLMGIPESLPRSVRQTAIGDFIVPGFTYFFRRDVKVQSKDLIVKVDWSPTGKPVYNNGGVYEVNLVQNHVLDGGKVWYVQVYVRDQPVQKDIRGIRIANTNGIKNYEIMQERND